MVYSSIRLIVNEIGTIELIVFNHFYDTEPSFKEYSKSDFILRFLHAIIVGEIDTLNLKDRFVVEIKKAPVIIIGSGIAGLLTALKLSDAGISSLVVTKTKLTENSSRMAQGGIAAVVPENNQDSIELHIQDTLNAGAGLSEEFVCRSILSEGHFAIDDLIKLGVPFDRVNGKLAFTKEAAHSTQRILHAGGDATGRSIQDTLIYRTQTDPNIEVLEECVALNLLVHKNRCYGVDTVLYQDAEHPQQLLLLGQHTILSTGGIGRLYSQTTNPAIATGDGMALAYTAGAKIQDMEFVQFHPTAFWAEGSVRFLISEALRGEGGILRDHDGFEFAKAYHPQGELAPRDIVTRAIWSQLQKSNQPHVFLDITHLPQDKIETRFPNILQHCLEYNIDIRKDWIPVAPAAHYGMGGVQVNTYGQTSIENLCAVGEVISSGIHGANRLASNSLLECVVLARRVAAHIEIFSEVLPVDVMSIFPSRYQNKLHCSQSDELDTMIDQLRALMWQDAGIIRNAEGLQHALEKIERLEAEATRKGFLQFIPDGVEFQKMLITSRLICQGALQREESRGAQYRSDFPEKLDVAKHQTQQMTVKEEVKA